MGKKNKGKAAKKGQGLAKTECKTLKKDERKTKKMLAEAGEEDIESLIAKFKDEDRKRVDVIESKCPPPSPRCNMTLTAHPDKDELIMFGGEFFNGSKTFVYNDLFLYNCKKNEWLHVSSPNQPAPRCAHQAVALRQDGGQLWIFGGEFASPSQLQFYHYKELWKLSLKDKQWQKINSPNGPSARSGHRMAACKKQLLVFGGFHDNSRHYKYYNDVHAFNLDTYTWSQLQISGNAPSPRSGCIFLSSPDHNSLLLFGGYSKVNVKKDVDKGTVHMDMFSLLPHVKNKDESVVTSWKWSIVKQSGCKPSARSGMAASLISNNRALLFGGVVDTEREDDDDMEGSFYNTMYTLETERGKWHETLLRGKRDDVTSGRKRRKRRESGTEGTNDSDDSASEDDLDETEENIKKLKLNPDNIPKDSVAMETESSAAGTTYDDGIFSVTVGPAPVTSQSDGNAAPQQAADYFMPPPRMNTLLVVQHGLLYLYGGNIEAGDKELTRTDMYVLDFKKMDEWKQLREDMSGAQDWISESESEDSADDNEKDGAATGGKDGNDDDNVSGSSSSDDDEEDEEEEDEEEEEEEEPPEVKKEESFVDYFTRSKTDFWLPLAKTVLEKEGKTDLSAKKLEKTARKMAETFHNS